LSSWGLLGDSKFGRLPGDGGKFFVLEMDFDDRHE
jgi:hypothetical protein